MLGSKHHNTICYPTNPSRRIVCVGSAVLCAIERVFDMHIDVVNKHLEFDFSGLNCGGAVYSAKEKYLGAS